MIKYFRLWNTPYIHSDITYMSYACARARSANIVRGKPCHLHAIWKSPTKSCIVLPRPAITKDRVAEL